MQTPFEKSPSNDYYELLAVEPLGAVQIVGSKSSEAQLSVAQREPIKELHALCGIFEGYKQTGENIFITKAEEYLAVWAKEYSPETSGRHIQISLDQRYFSWVFIETSDCWDALSEEGKMSAAMLAKKVVDQEEKFWEHNSNHNNRYAYSNLTRMASYAILKKIGDLEAAHKYEQTLQNFFTHVRENVYEDGSSLDFKVRDSVHYHVFNQIPWEISQKYLQEHGVAIPADVTDKLNSSLNFAMKYISGDETHLEFVHSTHERDAQIQGDKFGKTFDKDSYVAKRLLEIVESR